MSARAVAVGVGVALVSLGVWALWPGRVAHVAVGVTNETARRVQWVALDHERGGERIDDLAPRESRTLRFAVRGETSFRLRVRFVDGAELHGPGHYAEPGYTFHAAIRDSAVVVSPPETGY